MKEPEREAFEALLSGSPSFEAILGRCRRVHEALGRVASSSDPEAEDPIAVAPGTAVGDARPEAQPAVPAPCRVLGPYRLLRRLGQGGMGIVFLAEEVGRGDRRVALKLLPLPRNLSRASRIRFHREAQALAKLRHPRIVPVLRYDVFEGYPAIVMPFVDGIPLSDVIRSLRSDGEAGVHSLQDAVARARRKDRGAGTDAPQRARTIRAAWYFRAVCELGAWMAEALHTVHAHGIVHRDVKPSNILLDDRADPHLIDFGIARDLGRSTITRTGEWLGTPAYTAPEQLLGGPRTADPRVDVYALGATLFELAALSPPYSHDALRRRVREGFRGPPPRLRARQPAAPRALEAVLAKALEARPEARYATAAAFARDLGATARGKPIGVLPRSPGLWLERFRMHRARLAAVGVCLLLALAAAGLVRASLRLRARARETRYAERLARGLEHLRNLGKYPWGAVQGAEAMAGPFEEAAAIRPDRADPWFFAALVDARLGQPEAEWKALGEALARAPDHRAALLLRSRCARALARGPARPTWLERARRDEARLRSLTRLSAMADWLDADALARRGRWSEGIEAYGRALKAASAEGEPFPGFRHDAFLGRAMARLAEARFAEAVEDCAAARALCPASVAPDLLRACARYMQGDPESAEAILARVLQAYPERWAELIRIWEWLGDAARARRFADRAIARFPWDPLPRAACRSTFFAGVDTHTAYLVARLGGGRKHLGSLAKHIYLWRPAEAFRVIGEALKRRPDDPWVQCAWGRILMEVGRRKEAEAPYREALRLADTHFVRVRLGWCLYHQGRLGEAIQAFRTASILAGGTGLHDNGIATALYRAGRTRHAAEVWLRSLRAHLGALWATEGAATCIVEGLENPAGAMDDLVARYPQPRSYTVRTQVYEARGLQDALLERVGLEIEAGLHADLALYERGRVLAGRGRHAEAARDFRRAAALRPERAAYRAALAESLAALGRDEEAREARWTSYRFDPPWSDSGLRSLTADRGAALACCERWAEQVRPFGRIWVAIDRLLADRGAGPRDRIAYWERRDRQFPGVLWIRLCLARACEDAGRRDRAEVLYTQAARRDPDVDAWFDVYRLRRRREDPRSTCAFFRAEVRREPRDWRARMCAGDALLEAGATTAALAEYGGIFTPATHPFPEPRLWFALEARLARHLDIEPRIAFWEQESRLYPGDPVVRALLEQERAMRRGARAIRINAGGRAFVDELGNLWMEDRWYLSGFRSGAYGTPPPATGPEVLTGTWRSVPPHAGQPVYAIPLAAGSYSVRIAFATPGPSGRGMPPTVLRIRVGDGSARRLDLAVESETGASPVYPCVVKVADGILAIELAPIFGEARVAAIAVVPAGRTRGIAEREAVRARILAEDEDGAIARLRDAVGRYPDLNACLGIRLAGRQAYGEALPPLRAACRDEPENPRALAALAESLWALGRDAEAEAAAARAATQGGRSLADLGIARWRGASWRARHGGPSVAEQARRWRVEGDPARRDVADLSWLVERRFADQAPIRIDCGGPGGIDARGRAWSRDRFFVGGMPDRCAPEVPAAEGAFPYATCRRMRHYAGDLVYALPLPAGTYRVALHFAALPAHPSPRPPRTFDVVVAGRPVRTAFRPEAEAGGRDRVARVETEVRVDAGALEILLRRRTDDPLIAGIEIARVR